MDEVSEKLKVQYGVCMHGLQNPLNIFMALLQLVRIKSRIFNNDNNDKFQALSNGLNNEEGWYLVGAVVWLQPGNPLLAKRDTKSTEAW